MAEVTFATTLVRRDDLLVLHFAFHNLVLNEAATHLVRLDPTQPAAMTVYWPPQHMAEEAFFQDNSGGPPPGPIPVRARLAGASRLVFRLPDALAQLPYTMDALLDWTQLEPVLSPSALPPDAASGPAITPLTGDETAIEFPYRLFLSPDAQGGWQHTQQPVNHQGRYELWHSRLAQPNAAAASLRAVNYRQPIQPDPFLTRPRHDQLAEIVRLSADFSIRPSIPPQWFGLPPQEIRRRLRLFGVPEGYTPRPITAQQLLLSSLGAWARLESAWDYPTLAIDFLNQWGLPHFSLEQWQQISAMGRDQYVRTVEKGYACPTGHRLSIVEVVERQFEPEVISPPGTPAIFAAKAYLRYFKIIIVQEPEKEYSQFDNAYAFAGREMPLRKVRLTTLVTPKLDDSVSTTIPSWITAGGQDVQFNVIAEDWDGHQISFVMPLLFVPYAASGSNGIPMIEERYLGETRTVHALNNQTLAFAPGNGTDATYLKTNTIQIDLQLPPQLKTDQLPPTYPPRYLPVVRTAQVNIPAVDQLLGRSEPVAINLHDSYLNHGLDGPNAKAEVFVKLASPVQLNFAADKAGGIAKPDMAIDGLSRVIGAVGSVDQIQQGQIDTSLFAQAQLLGGITIKDILDAAGVAFDPADFRPDNLTPERLLDPAVRIKAPLMLTRQLPDSVETRYLWKPAIQNFEPLFKTKSAETGFADDAQLILEATLRVPRNGGSGAMQVQGRLQRFALNFVKILTVQIAELSFKASDGKKPDVSAEGVELIFEGPLKFVNSLRNILPADGFSDPPFVEIKSTGIVAGYTLGVPSVGVGIFSIQNIALAAALSVPFVAQPAGVRFAISERHHPFIVTVGFLGGGGFFALGVSAKGVDQIEAAIEFGGYLSLNLGIASGGVYIMAGIYFKMTGNSLELTGYLRCGGYLEILGIISISVEFYLSLSYRQKGSGGEVWGQASVTVKVKVLCFSKSVTLSIERKFAGDAGDPTFDQMIAPADWEAYCLAFA